MWLVTGVTGHIGNVLVRELLQREEKVRALILPNECRTPLGGTPRTSGTPRQLINQVISYAHCAKAFAMQ